MRKGFRTAAGEIMSGVMDIQSLDRAVVAAVFARAALVGWSGTSVASASRDAGLDLIEVRARFGGKDTVLRRFGPIMDQSALRAMSAEGTGREKLFDLLMGRFDALQAHRGGVLALLDALRTDPLTAAMLYAGTLRSMAFLLDAAEVPTGGLDGTLRVHGLAAVWAYALRAWQKDEGADMPGTMAALDRALDRAVQAEDMLPCRRGRGVEVSPPTLSGPDVAQAPDGPALL